ncbi:MAG TPA: 6-carboxytetrahydropterin synthase [Opitutaceae bacterium]|nr:6-carboxytetrahydropterin synthase [Opitutaceae bacterium]
MPVRPRPALPAGEVFVTRQVHFSASHRLYNARRSAGWNLKEYGECANERGHGHNYVLEATVAGVPDPETGYLLNLRTLKRILERDIVSLCDHRHLNEDVAFLAGVVPTTENLAIAFWRRLAPRIKSGRLHQVRLYETPRNFADYFGP